MHVEANYKPFDIMIYTDGSVTEDQSVRVVHSSRMEGLCKDIMAPIDPGPQV